MVRAAHDDADDVQPHILRIHVENKRVRQRLLLASRNSSLVLNCGQVAEDRSIRRDVGVKRLGFHELTTEECDLDGLVLIVGDINDGLSWPAID